MAEYKGLTIRIGGDTSRLNSALKSSTKAASTLQSQIRRIATAMRFDPSSLDNVNTRMRLTTNRAEALYSKLTLARNGYEQLGKETVTVGGFATTVANLADSTENVALAATTTKERYNDMTKALASNYRELERRAKEAGQAMNLNALSRQGTDETFESQMAQLKQLGVVTDEEIDRLRTMRRTWKEAFDTSEAYKAADELENMALDMQRFESEARNATSTVRELNSVSDYSASTWQESAARVKSMDSALSDAAKQARAYEAALREDPSNLSAAFGRLRALNSEYDLSVDKARELSRQVEAYKDRLSGVLAQERNLPEYIQRTGDEWQKVQDELLEAKGRADALRQSLQRLDDQQVGGEEFAKLEAEVREADARVEQLNVRAMQMDEAFETAKECSELQRLQVELSETESRAKAAQERMQMSSLGGKSLLNASTVKSAGMTLYSTLTPAITMLGWRAVSAAQDIDSAYRDMRKTVNGTEAQFEELKQAAIDFSKTHVTSADQMLEIMAVGGELGIAVEDLEKYAEVVSNLGVATNLTTDEAAETLGKLANITHMGAEEYDNYADALVRLGNNGASTEDQIVDIATRIGSMGTIVGLSVPEILALSSTIAATGMKTEASGTAIANTLSDMESAVAQGGDALGMFAEVAYGSADKADEFAKAWEESPIVAIQAFIEGLNRIEQEGGSADATLEAMGITGTRQKQALEGLMQTIGGLNDNLAMSNNAWNGVSDQWGEVGDAAREAERKAEGFSGQIAILSNVANDAMASLAEGATPLLAAFTALAQKALDLFDGMDDDAKSATVALLGLAAVSGPMLTMASTFITAKQNVTKFLTESNAMAQALAMTKAGFAEAGAGASGFRAKVATLKSAAATLGKSLLSGLGTAAVVAGITLIIAGIADLMRKMRDAEDASKDLGDIMSGSLDKRSLGAVSKSVDEVVRDIAESNRRIAESAEDTFAETAMVEDYGDALSAALEAYNADQTPDNLADLKTALELYNSATGTAITLTEQQDGTLALMKDDVILTADAFDRLTESIQLAAMAQFYQDTYTQKYKDRQEALEAVQTAQDKVEQAEINLQNAMEMGDAGAISAYNVQLQLANGELAKAQATLDGTTAAMEQAKEGLNLMTEAQLEEASAAARFVAENDEIQAAVWHNGRSVSEFVDTLDKLGVSYDDMVLHADGIKQLANTWNGNTSDMVRGLEALGIEVDETRLSAEELDAMELQDKFFTVSDGGSVGKSQGKVGGLKRDINSIVGKTVTVTAIANKVGIDNLAATINGIKDKTVTVVADFLTRSATGSVSKRPYIPEHAKGYIAKGPTLTNNGWVGEDGAEAVLNWGTGGAVVPLTNRRYMEPIAEAIAANMGHAQGGDVYSVTINGATINDNAAMRDATRDYLIEMKRLAAI